MTRCPALAQVGRQRRHAADPSAAHHVPSRDRVAPATFPLTMTRWNPSRPNEAGGTTHGEACRTHGRCPMTRDPTRPSRLAGGYDEPPGDARVRALLALTLLTLPDIDGDGRVRLVEFDFDPAHYDPVDRWDVVTTAESCPQCHRTVQAGEHVALTARGRRLCVDCGACAQ